MVAAAKSPIFALPATLKRGLEDLIVDEVHRQVPKVFHAAQRTQGVPPKTPEESLRCMTANEGMEIHLVASEPQISDPVAIDFGPDGRLWVAEMRDYGHGVYESFDQSSRVRWLRDEDNDGFFETARTFVDGLRFPTDVKVWRDGVLICDAPDILFARDTEQRRNGRFGGDTLFRVRSPATLRHASTVFDSDWTIGFTERAVCSAATLCVTRRVRPSVAAIATFASIPIRA